MGLAWLTLMVKASVVCPESVRPLLSTMVPETNIGTRGTPLSNSCWMAKRAACHGKDDGLISKGLRWGAGAKVPHLGIGCVKNGLHQEEVHSPVQQTCGLLSVSINQFIKGCKTKKNRPSVYSISLVFKDFFLLWLWKKSENNYESKASGTIFTCAKILIMKNWPFSEIVTPCDDWWTEWAQWLHTSRWILSMKFNLFNLKEDPH